MKKQTAISGSAVESRYIVMPNHTNQYGTAFGGVIVAWIDMLAAMAAQKHCGKEVVTASIDFLSFDEPIYIGDHLILRAKVNYVGTSSMEIGVEVFKDNPGSNQEVKATTAYLTFVALDDNKKPIPVEPVVPKTAEEKRLYANAKMRVLARKKLLKKLKSADMKNKSR